MKRLLILMACCLQTLLLSAAYAQSENGVTQWTRTKPVPTEFFGLIIHRAHLGTRWPALPFGSWRLWDSYLKWSDIQPSQGVWEFDAFDRQVDLGEKYGKELIYTFGQTPTWASSVASEKHAWGMGAGGMPKNIEDWRMYVTRVVTRYKGRIRGYEVWNEPKYKELGRCKGAIFFCGTPEELVLLTRTAHEVIQEIDPNALLATPGFTDGLRGVKRLDEYLAAGGAAYVNAISFHFYELEPEKALETLAALRAVMYKYGLAHLPIWNSEVGYLIQNQNGDLQREQDAGAFSRVFSPADAGARLARVVTISAAGGVERVYWYAWDDKRMGLTGSNDGIPNEAATAYRVVRRWLLGSTLSCSGVSGLWSCKLTRGNRTATLLWREQLRNASYVLPMGAPKAVEDLFEGRKVLNGESVLQWNGAPILIADDTRAWVN